MNPRSNTIIIHSALALLLTACSSKPSKTETATPYTPLTEVASFSADSAYSHIKAQVGFGPRIPGSEGSKLCQNYIIDRLNNYGVDDIIQQTGKVTAFTNEIIPYTNILGRFQSSQPQRILLVAHYDTRPWADSDVNPENHQSPIPGANDGASGVSVLLEIARHISTTTPEIGIDMLFVDAEDYGQLSGFSNHDETWCLGTQEWVKKMPYPTDSLPRYALLLDMVGGAGARFNREYFSDKIAPAIVDKIWSIAQRSGYGDIFLQEPGGAVVDDHLFINGAGIPAIDIIESKNRETRTFPSTWHTMNDDLRYIDPASLKAAGQTVLNAIYLEKP